MKRVLVLLAALAALHCAAQPVTPPPIAARAFIVVDALSGQTLAAANARRCVLRKTAGRQAGPRFSF